MPGASPLTSPTAGLGLEPVGTRRTSWQAIHGWLLAGMVAWICLGLAGQLHLALYGSLANSIDLLYDDAYYYLGVAWNLAHHHRSVFTEPLPTNGYHPLWLLILAAMTALFDLSRQGLVISTLVLTALLKCAGLILFDRGQPDAWRRTIGRIALFIVLWKYAAVFSVGMETTLFVIFIPWLLRVASRPTPGPRHGLALGLLMCAVFLSRLDALALDAAVLALALASRRLSTRQAMGVIALLLLTIAVYASINLQVFGTPLPVSGQAKAIGSRFGGNLRTSWDFILNLRWVGAMLAVWALARLTVAPRLHLGGFELGSLALATGACALYYGMLSGWPIWPWYLYPNAFLAVYATVAGAYGLIALFSSGLNRLPHGTGVRAAYQLAGVLFAAAASLGFLARAARGPHPRAPRPAAHFLQQDRQASGHSSYNRQNVALVPWLEAHYPGGAAIAMGDRAGGLGYWMPERHTMVQLEGLVADKEFLTVLASGQLASYLAAKHVDIYISDRQRAFRSAGIIGFVEPAQPRLMTGTLNVLCFAERDQLLSQDYLYGSAPQLRRVYDYRKRIECPAEILDQVRTLQSRFDGIRAFTGL